ncbi:MAG: nuclear transport factor 2 family protein [Myxococcales bacterium]|nr:nuclear transport factor 2 family protein [Myxococcales bacterium]MDD9970686.1 nuclear transport factor 2 family protein [Myxococcales bacterium]
MTGPGNGGRETSADVGADALVALEQRRCAAISAGDTETLKSLLSEDYVHVHMNAAVDDREGHLTGIGKRPRTTTRADLHVRIFGQLAVLTGELLNVWPLPGGESRTMRAYCHQVAVHRGGAWRFVSTQLTPLREK